MHFITTMLIVNLTITTYGSELKYHSKIYRPAMQYLMQPSVNGNDMVAVFTHLSQLQ